MKSSTLVLAGAGKMGGAMLQGWLALGLDPKNVSIVEPYPSDDIKSLCAKHAIALNVVVSAPPDVLVLAIKPQTLNAAAPELAALAGPDTLVVSILAGKTIADLQARLPKARAFVRAMPNTPAAVGRGITGVSASAATSQAQKDRAHTLLGSIGQVVWLDDEALIDAVTAVSGSGPAYVFYLVECMAKAGEAAGLPADIAMRLARATVEGSGELLFKTPETDAAQLRKNVTSPGGTTAAALDVLMADDGLAPLMTKAIGAAKHRAGELSG